MRLTSEQIVEYQKMYKANFGIVISKDDALNQAMALVRLVKIVQAKSQNNKDENVNAKKYQSAKN